MGDLAEEAVSMPIPAAVARFNRRVTNPIALIYGSGTDWLANVIAAGGATIERSRRRRYYAEPRIVADGEGAARIPSVVRFALGD
jgi:hypothetical protein